MYCWLKLRIARPRPCGTPPGPSPMIVPTMLAAAAILSAGEQVRARSPAAGPCGRRPTWTRRTSASARPRADRASAGRASTAIVTGKKVRYVAMITTLVRPRPKLTTITGARATIGIVWLATTYGTNARSNSPKWTKIDARTMPISGAEPRTRAAPRPMCMPPARPGSWRGCSRRCAGTARRTRRRCPTGAAG